MFAVHDALLQTFTNDFDLGKKKKKNPVFPIFWELMMPMVVQEKKNSD